MSGSGSTIHDQLYGRGTALSDTSIYRQIDPSAAAGTAGATPWFQRFDTPQSINALMQLTPQQPAAAPQNALAPPVAAPEQPQAPPTTNLTVQQLMEQLRGDKPPAPVTQGMSDNNLVNYIYGTPQLQAMLRPEDMGPAYPGASLYGQPTYGSGTG